MSFEQDSSDYNLKQFITYILDKDIPKIARKNCREVI